ncbi:hypothetical protein JX266_013807 [Neoarthrinium moseri]|nr:hypothetical protein JX266_013807 [Neoarthrinium moseri]
MRFFQAIAPVAVLANVAIARSNHFIQQEDKERHDFLATQKRTSLAHCAEMLKVRHVNKHNVARRAKRNLKKRATHSALAADHNKTSLGYTLNYQAPT